MTETTARAALIAEAAGYDGYCYFCGDLMPNLAAALAEAEIELAVARAIVNEAIRGDRERYQKIDEQAAIIQAVREWSIQWGRDTRRAMAREALEAILKG